MGAILPLLPGKPCDAFLSARGELACCLAPDTVPILWFLVEKKPVPVLALTLLTGLFDKDGRKFGSIPPSAPALLTVRFWV